MATPWMSQYVKIIIDINEFPLIKSAQYSNQVRP